MALRKTSHFLILILLSLMAGNAIAQEVSVKSHIDTTTILTGDQIFFSVTLEKPADLDLTLNQLTDTIVSGIDIVRGPLTDTVLLGNSRIAIRQKYLITSFDSGRYEIQPVYAEMMTKDGLKRFYSDYLYLNVKRTDIAPPDTTMKYFDIIGPYKVPVTVEEVFPWLLVAAAAAALAWFLIRYIKNRKRREAGQLPEVPAEPAYVLAYRSLEKLKNEKLWQRGLFKEYFSGLSDILRNYLDNRYGMNSMESTTSEILSSLAMNEDSNTEASDRLRQVLEISDMVKFAKLIPDSSDCDLSMEHSWSFVSMTRKERIHLQEEPEENINDSVTGKEES
jgi:hypothetical protein